ncbi:glycosyltransferase [Tundrisphaera lichenicola]|uniref:glycosyltransferase n=1 Tax=Tundrisphaera lichenicola TaxID=2029860 RepID=UPI003EBB5CA7
MNGLLSMPTNVPRLSVVVASVNGWSMLEPTLRALDAQPERARMEILVVESVGGETRRKLREHRPAVELIEVDDKRTIPALRHLGVVRSRGEIVAILEDHGEVGPDWASALLKAHEGPWGAVGGVVENGRDGLVDWAAFFCEYAPYMGPVAEGESADLPGNNIAYKRPHLLRHAGELEQGRWESWINDKIRADGVPIASTNRAIVRHIKPFRLGHFLIQRFHFARSYAGMRRVDQSPARRLIYGFGSLALPALLTLRVSRIALGKRRHLGRFAASLPLIVLFYTIGAVGEMIGYLIGPGDSLSRVE